MAYSALVEEAQSGLRGYRDELLDIHKTIERNVDLEEIRRCLAIEGVNSSSPLITIPFEAEHLKNVMDLSEKHGWHHPFATSWIANAYDLRLARDAGKPASEVGLPKPFWSILMDVAVVFDDSPINASDFGETYATGLAILDSTHEIAHSAFANHSAVRFRKVSADTVRAEGRFGISRDPWPVTLKRGECSESRYQPVWIDEAFAQHMAAVVRGKIYPQSVPAQSREITFTQYGSARMEVPQQHLIMSDEYPDQPGPAAGPEGVSMDILMVKRPWLLPQLKALTRGTISMTAVHDNLRNGLGTELYADMTQRRPYTAWGGILEQIKALDTV